MIRKLLITIALIGGAAQGAQVLSNPGFESGVLTPWVNARSFGTVTAPWSITSTNCHSGSFCAVSSGNIELKQTFAPVADSTITDISFYGLHTSAAVTGLAVDLFYQSGADDEFVLNTSGTTWNFFDVFSHLRAGDSLVGISVFGNSGGVTMVDDFSITATSPALYISDSGNNRIRMVNTSSGTITTVAGNGTAGYSGDGGPATSAELSNPFGLAVDSSGNLYIADTQNNRIRMVNPSGTITTIAGTGAPSYSGDGGPATSAGLNNPTGVAVDRSGNLYIADQRNNRIRKVTSGTITTVAGNGNVGNGGDGGPATSAQLYYPEGVAVDGAGDIYIADADNQRIRKVNTGGTISTLAGNGNEGFNCNNGTATSLALNHSSGVALDGSGDLYIADYGNQCVRKVNSGNITTVAGNGIPSYGGDGGPASSAQLNYPTSVAVDNFGNLYIADFANNRIREVSTTGTITTIAGNGTAGFTGDGGPATSARLYNPSGVAVTLTPNPLVGP